MEAAGRERSHTSGSGDLFPTREVFLAFAKLGVTAFGGPIAHLGYFRDEFVVRRRWLAERQYADLVALCQFLPGPASSQVGLALGLLRAGPWGALAAWTAFTLPSAILLVLFAYGAVAFAGPATDAVIHGLKIAAVVIVAQAVLGMARSLAPDAIRATIAVAATTLALLAGSFAGQLAAIVLGAIAGTLLLRGLPEADGGTALPQLVSRRTSFICLAAFAVLLATALLLAATTTGAVQFVAGVAQAGALVFGGGHVILPLLEAQTVETGLVGAESFLAGYGAAQTVPGPLFTFAAYLGAVAGGPFLALIALVAIFLPGMFLLLAALSHWSGLAAQPAARSALAGTNAAVVGILAGALYDPVFVSAISHRADFVVAAAGFVLACFWKAPSWSIVLFCALAGALAFRWI